MKHFTSEAQTPQASSLMTTSPGPGLGTGTLPAGSLAAMAATARMVAGRVSRAATVIFRSPYKPKVAARVDSEVDNTCGGQRRMYLVHKGLKILQ